MENYNICHICNNFDAFYFDFMDELQKKSIDFRVFYFRSIDRGQPNIEGRDYLDVRLNYKNWQRLFFLHKEKQVLKDFEEFYDVEKFNLLHAHTLFSNGYIAYKIKQKYKIPYIVAVRDMDLNLFFKHRVSLRKLGINILKNAEKIIFISENYLTQLLDLYVPENLKKELREKSVIIPNGINEYYHENSYLRVNRPRPESLNVITVGYISKRKNQLLVAEALKLMETEGIQPTYTVVGKILDKEVNEKLKKYNFVNHVPFVGKEDLISLYRENDIFIMPSITETFGLTYVEAMTQSLPVIYSKNQGFDAYFEDGQVGYGVKNNVEDVIEKIKLLLDNYQNISKNAYESSRIFNWEDVIENYTSIYDQIVRGESNEIVEESGI